MFIIATICELVIVLFSKNSVIKIAFLSLISFGCLEKFLVITGLLV